jgi:myo-inositol catabolism protein IolC
MRKADVLLLALDSTIKDIMKFNPDDWKNANEDTRKSIEKIYLRAKQNKEEILAIMYGEKELED